jgi:His/Glu/Gln/Arg/opine family amino acid ABC transporter permease subunit
MIAIGVGGGAIVWGALLVLFRLTAGRWGSVIVDAYVQLLRNVPSLLVIYLFYFGAALVGLYWPAVLCGGIALILQDGAYVSEIFRGSLKAIDRVQVDAARSLGLSPWRAFRKVTLPQLLVYSIPALGNHVILMTQNTSLLSAIAVNELTMQAKRLTERTAAVYQAFLAAALLYLVLVSAVALLFRVAHRSVRWRAV